MTPYRTKIPMNPQNKTKPKPLKHIIVLPWLQPNLKMSNKKTGGFGKALKVKGNNRESSELEKNWKRQSLLGTFVQLFVP